MGKDDHIRQEIQKPEKKAQIFFMREYIFLIADQSIPIKCNGQKELGSLICGI